MTEIKFKFNFNLISFIFYHFFRFWVPFPRGEFQTSHGAHGDPKNQKWHDSVEPGGGGGEGNAPGKCEFIFYSWALELK